MHITNIHEAKTHLSQLIQRALGGEQIVIARAGEPLVQLTPFVQDSRPREGGQWRGRIWIADDFDAPDPELEKLFFGSDE